MILNHGIATVVIVQLTRKPLYYPKYKWLCILNEIEKAFEELEIELDRSLLATEDAAVHLQIDEDTNEALLSKWIAWRNDYFPLYYRQSGFIDQLCQKYILSLYQDLYGKGDAENLIANIKILEKRHSMPDEEAIDFSTIITDDSFNFDAFYRANTAFFDAVKALGARYFKKHVLTPAGYLPAILIPTVCVVLKSWSAHGSGPVVAEEDSTCSVVSSKVIEPHNPFEFPSPLLWDRLIDSNHVARMPTGIISGAMRATRLFSTHERNVEVEELCEEGTENVTQESTFE